MNANVIEFYKKLRTDKGLIEALSEGKTTEEFIKATIDKAAEMGITLQAEDVVAACGNFEELCKLAANDDELTEFELEVIAGGNGSGGFPGTYRAFDLSGGQTVNGAI